MKKWVGIHNIRTLFPHQAISRTNENDVVIFILQPNTTSFVSAYLNVYNRERYSLAYTIS